MTDQPSSRDLLNSIELTEQEATEDFTHYWTPERKHHAKLLAKKLSHTSLDAIEHNGLKAKQLPEQNVRVTPADPDTNRTPEQPTLHISTGSLVENHLKIYRLTETNHYP